MPDDLKETYIHNYRVQYDDDAEAGVRHLDDDLDAEEARVFFDQARLRGKAAFEDDQERNFVLTYRGGQYFLNRR